MKQQLLNGQGDIRYPITWTTLGGYLETLEKRGISPNVAAFVGAGEVREYVLGSGNVQPNESQIREMRKLVHEAMEQGALGVTTALIYSPYSYAKTDELISLATESANCGGIYTVHMRSEGDRIEEAVDETIAISKGSGAPAEIYHLKLAGRDNWQKWSRLVQGVRGLRPMFMPTLPAGQV